MRQSARIRPGLTEPIFGSAKRTSRTLAVRTHSGGSARGAAASRPRCAESAVVPRGSGSKPCSFAGEHLLVLPRCRAERFQMRASAFPDSGLSRRRLAAIPVCSRHSRASRVSPPPPTRSRKGIRVSQQGRAWRPLRGSRLARLNHCPAPDSHLYLWAPVTKLPDALTICDAWGVPLRQPPHLDQARPRTRELLARLDRTHRLRRPRKTQDRPEQPELVPRTPHAPQRETGHLLHTRRTSLPRPLPRTLRPPVTTGLDHLGRRDTCELKRRALATKENKEHLHEDASV
jgi:hypothetical protein